MQISYKVHSKHRASKPTANASVWNITHWEEIYLFSQAGKNDWSSKNKTWYWALQENFSVIGMGIENGNKSKFIELRIAKFVEDQTVWHGYPVQPRGSDIPPESVLDDWLAKEFINKAEKSRLIGGKF